jgi:hypothetical protein
MRLTVKAKFVLPALVVLAGLIYWDHSFQSAGWVPSLGANIITMIATVFVLDAMIEGRKAEAAGEILRDSLINVAEMLAGTADLLVECPGDAPPYERLIESWIRVRDRLERDISYCASDLNIAARRRVKHLDDKVRHYAAMGWGDYKGEQLIVGKDVVEAWRIVSAIQADLYKTDANMETLFSQVRERIEAMIKSFTPYW